MLLMSRTDSGTIVTLIYFLILVLDCMFTCLPKNSLLFAYYFLSNLSFPLKIGLLCFQIGCCKRQVELVLICLSLTITMLLFFLCC